jgi:hypothetical protein
MATVRVQILTVRIILSVCPFNRMAHTANTSRTFGKLYTGRMNPTKVLYPMDIMFTKVLYTMDIIFK